MNKQSSQRGTISVSVIVSIVASLLFVFALLFGLMTFTSKQSLQKNFDAKVSETIDKAVKTAEDKKDADFAEKDKSPTKTYNGSTTFGSVSFSYPKLYSAYVVEMVSTTGTPLDGFFQPNIVPIAGPTTLFALRFQVVGTAYDTQLKEFDGLLKSGKVSAKPFRAAKVPSTLGVRIEGEIGSGKTGVLILLPLRDKTLRLWTESRDYVADFDKFVLPSLNFVP